jgi:hypothetical protein
LNNDSYSTPLVEAFGFDNLNDLKKKLKAKEKPVKSSYIANISDLFEVRLST